MYSGFIGKFNYTLSIYLFSNIAFSNSFMCMNSSKLTECLNAIYAALIGMILYIILLKLINTIFILDNLQLINYRIY